MPAATLSHCVILLLCLAVQVGRADPVKLSPQVITLPANAGAPLFVDIEGNGRCNLLVIDTAEKKLLNYRQRPDGFTNSPDQVIPLPPQTAWVAPCDVDAHPGLELLMSTAAGLFYYRQNAGRFESERHPLIEVSQGFTNYDLPTLTLLNTNKTGTNDLIPVISAGQTVLYHRNSAYEWSPGPPLALDVKQTAWHANQYLWRDLWALGPNPAHSLDVEQSFRAKPEPARDKEPENEVIRKIIADMKIADMKKTPPRVRPNWTAWTWMAMAGKIWFCGRPAAAGFQNRCLYLLARRGPKAARAAVASAALSRLPDSHRFHEKAVARA